MHDSGDSDVDGDVNGGSYVCVDGNVGVFAHTHVNTEQTRDKRRLQFILMPKKSNKTRAIDAADEYARKVQKKDTRRILNMEKIDSIALFGVNSSF